MSFGIIKGAQTEVAIPTKGICIPVGRYDDKRFILKAGSTQKLDISGIAEYGDLGEEYQFSVNLTNTPDILAEGTTHKYELYDEEQNLITSIEFTVSGDFATSLGNAFSGNSTLYSLINYDVTEIANGNIYFTAVNTGVKYRHLFYFDTTGFGGADPYPYIHPGNLVQKYRKYPEGRVKVILIVPQFDKIDTASCSCADSSGLILSNKKYFQYATASEYERIKTPRSPILAAGDQDGTSFVWSNESTDHIGYHFSTNDLVNMSTASTKRALIQSIQGFAISTDTGIGNNTETYLSHVWSPNTVQWKNIGEMSLFTGGQDVNTEDQLLIETLYLKNPHTFDIPMRILIGV
jgi:hypothetical protein